MLLCFAVICLLLYIVTATVFATCFGSGTMPGIPAIFLKEGMKGAVATTSGSKISLVWA